MKRLLTFIALTACAISSAQNIDDVLRYSTENLQGTARFQGMGGAFGALGGDLSGLSANPAGSAVFSNSLFTFTGTYFDRRPEALYRGTLTNDNSNSLEINQVGGALVFKTKDPDSNGKRFPRPLIMTWYKILMTVSMPRAIVTRESIIIFLIMQMDFWQRTSNH